MSTRRAPTEAGAPRHSSHALAPNVATGREPKNKTSEKEREGKEDGRKHPNKNKTFSPKLGPFSSHTQTPRGRCTAAKKVSETPPPYRRLSRRRAATGARR